MITDSEIEQILEVIEREDTPSRLWYFDFRKSAVFNEFVQEDFQIHDNLHAIAKINFTKFIKKVIKEKSLKKCIVLFSASDTVNPREQLTVKTATKKLFFSETLLLFHPEIGLILKKI